MGMSQWTGVRTPPPPNSINPVLTRSLSIVNRLVHRNGLWACDHVTYQSFLLHALHHHEEDLLRLAAVVVKRFLDGDEKLIFDAVTHQPENIRETNSWATPVMTGSCWFSTASCGRFVSVLTYWLNHMLINHLCVQWFKPTLVEGGSWHSHPSSSQYLWAKEMMSDARPLPSQTTTGTGGSSFKLSRTMAITLGPPSRIKHTNGTPWPRPETNSQFVEESFAHPPPPLTPQPD